MAFSVTAIMTLSSEADIIRYVLRHLQEQGVGVYVINNWSSDGSAEIAQEFPLVGYEKFPVDGPSPFYSWRLLLQRVEQVAHDSKSDWIILYDSDEIRRSNRKNENLVDGLARVDAEGYNAVNFQVYHFMPVDDTYVGEPESHFRYYTVDHPDCKMRQIKAWKNTGVKVDLASTGGHAVAFPGLNVSPEKFILKHYPLRTSAQAARKVLKERVGRYDPVERAMQWHVQYDRFTRAIVPKWIHDPKELREWKEATA